MGSIGIVRRIDKLGRITLAKEDRTVLGINEQDPVVMVREGNEIKIKKYEKDCGVRIDIWTHLTRECIINYVH